MKRRKTQWSRKKKSCSSQEEHVLKRPLSESDLVPVSCSSQEEHVLKRNTLIIIVRRVSCSSQEEHVLKLKTTSGGKEIPLLLARGACIETVTSVAVLPSSVLLLARGACIETASKSTANGKPMLLLARGACIETNNFIVVNKTLSCSSQEEHVLKRYVGNAYDGD